jgi:hypothetical protein
MKDVLKETFFWFTLWVLRFDFEDLASSQLSCFFVFMTIPIKPGHPCRSKPGQNFFAPDQLALKAFYGAAGWGQLA